MGKPGGFFKRLKAKQARAASRRRRGTKGASKEERKAKQAEKAEYYAAKRTAEQLAAISSSSDDDDDYDVVGGVSSMSNSSNRLSHKKRHRRDVDSDEEVEQLAQRRLQRLRAVLGVKTRNISHTRRELQNKSKKSMHDSDDDDVELEEEEVEKEDEEDEEDERDVDQEFMESTKHHDSSSNASDDDYDESDKFLIEDEDMEDRNSENDTEGEEEEEEEEDDVDEDDEDEDENGILNPLLALEEEEEEEKEDYDLDKNVVLSDEESDEEEEEVENDEDDTADAEDPYYSENDNEKDVNDDDIDAASQRVNGGKRVAFALEPTNGKQTHSTMQDEASLLLPHFELGTSSLEVIVQNTPIHRDDVWLQKYHLDVYDHPNNVSDSNKEQNTDTSATEHMSNVIIPTSVINKLKHSNDELVAKLKTIDVHNENVTSKHHNDVSQDGVETQLEEAERKLFTVHTNADLLEWQPENISIMATRTAQHHFKHPPFDVKDAFITTTSASAMTSDAMPEYMHPTLWSKFVEYKLRAINMTREKDMEEELEEEEGVHSNVAKTSKADKTTKEQHVPLLTYEERGLLDLLEVYCDVLDCTRM